MLSIRAWLADVVAAPRQHPGALVSLVVVFAVLAVLTTPWLLGPLLVAGISLFAIGAVVYVAVRLALRDHQPR
jgi:sugar phosphate permease